MKIQDVRTFTVIGSGTMGHSIAEVVALAGYPVNLFDSSSEHLEQATSTIQWSLSKMAERGLISTELAAGTFARVLPVPNLEEAVKNVEMVIEAVSERMTVKRSLFSKIDELASPEAVYATNTSSLSVTEIADVTRRPHQVFGMHFFTPPVMNPMVEIIRGANTSEETLQLGLDLAVKFGKEPLLVKKDVRGFIVNRAILGPYLAESARIVSRGEGSVEQIDSFMKYQEKVHFGPFELLDLIGIDILADVLREEGTPVPLVIEQKCDRKDLGRKTGQGFYDYRRGKPSIPDLQGFFDPVSIYSLMANEAAWLVENEVTTPDQIDRGARVAAGFSGGILPQIERIGFEKIVQTLDTHNQKYGDLPYRVTGLLRAISLGKEKKERLTGRSF